MDKTLEKILFIFYALVEKPSFCKNIRGWAVCKARPILQACRILHGYKF